MKPLLNKIILCCFICLALGLASGVSTSDAINNWYQYIEKPSWNPPNWLFGPVWTLLYLMMGASLAIIWHSKHPYKRKALQFFAIQFTLNLLWSFIFFNLHQIGLALIEILIMLTAIIITIFYFNKINKAAAYLLVPYALWVSFASVLNFTIWYLNK